MREISLVWACSPVLESGEYFAFALDPRHRLTAFRTEIGNGRLNGFLEPLPRIRRPQTTELQYRRAVASLKRHSQPPGTLLQWVCHDRIDYLDLMQRRLELSPS